MWSTHLLQMQMYAQVTTKVTDGMMEKSNKTRVVFSRLKLRTTKSG